MNSVQAAMLNGGLDQDHPSLSDLGGVELPLQADDTFEMIFTISSATGQTDVEGDAITAFSKKVRLLVKLH